MSEEEKQLLERQLWNIANALRGKMNADEFRVYILGFIFYKYLSEKMENYADELLKEDDIKYANLEDEDTIIFITKEAVGNIGFSLASSELFSNIAKKGNNGSDNFILDDLPKIFGSF